MQSNVLSQQAMGSPTGGQGLCLLSIDGGGVRGLSALYVLKQLMAFVNDKTGNKPPLKPCDYFDMIGGTSTGGIIAIMLGRLQMDVQECIDIYLELADTVFSKVHHLPTNLRGRTHGRYNQDALEQAIINILEQKQLPPDTLLKNEDQLACKVFVCAKRLSINTLVAFTSYETLRIDNDLFENATILQACRATSAAPTYFEPLEMQLGPKGAEYTASFVDGGLGYNNPVGELWTQAADIWKGPLESKVECVVSIGTGKPTLPDYGTSAIDLGKRLLAIATDSENIAGQFYQHHRHDLGRRRYYRFNVDRGLENVDLGEAKQKARIIEVTKEYIKDGEVFDKMEDCAEKLATREWFRFLLLCLKRLDELSRTQLLSRSSTVDAQTAEDHIAWLTNTRAFSAWMSPARGEVLCSRWLWYPGSASEEFVSSFTAYFHSLGSRVLFFDCSQLSAFSAYEALVSKYSKGNSTAIAVIMWTLISQAFGPAALKTEHVALRIAERIGSQGTKRNSEGDAPMRLLSELLRSSLNFDSDQDFVLLLHHADKLDINDLETLRNATQDVMDSQRLPDVAQTRAFLTCKRNYETEVALKGIVAVDEATEYHECVLSLRFRTMNLRRNRITPIELDSKHWLWSHPSYLQWIHKSAGVLWFSGKPGSGKSTIARSIQNHLSVDTKQNSASGEPTKTKHVVCSWFYSGRDGLVSHRLMLRSILVQILIQEASLFAPARSVYRETKNESGDAEWTADCLQEALLLIAKASKGTRDILCVIDGVDESLETSDDEAEMSRDATLSLLERLTISFKVLVLSRYHHGIERRLRQSLQIVMQQENLPDVRRAVDEGLVSLFKVIKSDESTDEIGSLHESGSSNDKVSQQRPLPSKSRLRGRGPGASGLGAYQRRVQAARQDMLNQFREHLLEHASGVILWVVTVISALKNRVAVHPSYTAKQLWAELKGLPSDVDELYAGIVSNLASAPHEAVDFARRALIWVNVATAKRPFQLQELFEALRVPEIDGDVDEDEDPFTHMGGVDSPTSFYRYIHRFCGPFIEIVKPQGISIDGSEETTLQIKWRDQIQLIHQTVKVFLETSEAAGPFRLSFEKAERHVEEESLRYLRLALPETPNLYVPLPVQTSSPWRDNVEIILTYLEEKALLSFILGVFPSFTKHVSRIYRFIFENTTNPPIEPSALPDASDSDFEIGFYLPRSSKKQDAVVEHYFKLACEAGWNTAIENLFHLASLRFETERWRWYREEVAILHGTLVVAIRHRLLPQVRKIAWYIQQRGIDLLYLPDDVRLGTGGQAYLVEEALHCGDMDIASTVIGYKDAAEKQLLLESLESRMRTQQVTNAATAVALREAAAEALTEHDTEAIREAVETVIGFWKRPSTYDRASGEGASYTYTELNEPHFGPNVGPNLGYFGANLGANINAETHAYMAAAREMFVAEMIAKKQDEKRSSKDRKEWLSHQDLCRDVAILHGARNATPVRLQPIDLEGHKVGDEVVSPPGAGYAELRAAQIEERPMQMQAQTTGEEFAEKMNRTAWKSASSAAWDKIY